MILLEFFEDNKQIKENSNISDVLQARDLIHDAMRDTHKKYLYFDYLKFLRNKYGEKYSTDVHKQASKLVKAE